MQEQKPLSPLLIIDGYGFVYRAYHVQPPLTAPDGQAVGAIYGLTSMLFKLISDFKPEYAVIVLDSSGENFRHKLFPQYKANRSPAPDDLITQLPIVRDAAKALNFKILEQEGFEADDIIASLAKKCVKDNRDAIVISADKDLLQLMNDKVRIYDPAKSRFIQESDIVKKFGVLSDKVREVQALMGDSSDNIPGVRGIGPKTASKLINEFGNLENLYQSLSEIKNPRWQKLLLDYKKDAMLSWQLVGLDLNVNVAQDLNSLVWTAPDSETISAFINKYGFRSLHKRAQNLFNIKINENNIIKAQNLNNKVTKEPITINDDKLSDGLLAKIYNEGIISILLFEEKNDNHIAIAISSDIFLIKNKAAKNDLIDRIFSDQSIKKITINLKKIYRSIKLFYNGFDDLQLMYYCLSAGTMAKSIIQMINHYTDNDFDDNVSLIKLLPYFFDVYSNLKQELFLQKNLHLYETIDLPLCRILAKMEIEGIKIDIQYLDKLSKEFTTEVKILEQKIFKLSGEEFNISSPKQLGGVLFEKLKLPFAKISNKTQTYSTGFEVLEKLSEKNYEIADLVLKHRHLSKLKNTYTESLPKQMDNSKSRIHTHFLQTSTSTGRLSSVDPNLQNIPVRSSEGHKIRGAFVAKEGYKFISADYSQIELRILSHVANIPALKQAFIEGKDVHRQTASQIFAIDLDKVTSEIRYKAKAINFGIIYGISAFGLAKNINISRKEAAEYIAKYFQEYPGIEEYMNNTIEFAKKYSYVPNLFGRRCYLPMINNKNYSLRSFAQRAAINAPMQSLTADIVKMAMVKIDKIFHDRSLKTQMILQIHDELIFEAPKNEVEIVSKIVKSAMENIIILDIPIKVDISCGDNWQAL